MSSRIDAGRPVIEALHQQTADERFTEAMFTGLRLSEGIDAGGISARFGQDPWVRYGGELAPVLDAGLMWRRDSRLGLTRQGMLVSNEILTTFV